MKNHECCVDRSVGRKKLNSQLQKNCARMKQDFYCKNYVPQPTPPKTSPGHSIKILQILRCKENLKKITNGNVKGKRIKCRKGGRRKVKAHEKKIS